MVAQATSKLNKPNPSADLGRFDYESLGSFAGEVKAAAAKIRQSLKRSVQEAIEIGHSLLHVKNLVKHGEFGYWLQAEFGWSERTAQNFMSVAERFAPATVADLPILPSVAYHLASASVPDEAREAAIERAKAGERITLAVAKEIVGLSKKRRRTRTAPMKKLKPRVAKMLVYFRDVCVKKDHKSLAKQLRDFAELLDGKVEAADQPEQEASVLYEATSQDSNKQPVDHSTN